MVAICLLPSSSILQSCLSQYAVLRNRHTFAIWWAKPGYHGNAVSGGLDDRFDVCQHVSVVRTPERVWRSEKTPSSQLLVGYQNFISTCNSIAITVPIHYS